MIPSLAEATVPEHVLKTWSALPTAVRKALVDSELNQAGLSISSSGIATSSLTDDRADDGAPIHDIGLSLSNSFGSTIKTEDSADADTSDFIDDFRNDTEDARRNLSRTPRTSRTHRTNYSSASIITVTVSNLPPSNSSPPHLLGLRPPRDSEDASLHAPPVLQVLNRMPEYPIIGEHIKQKLDTTAKYEASSCDIYSEIEQIPEQKSVFSGKIHTNNVYIDSHSHSHSHRFSSVTTSCISSAIPKRSSSFTYSSESSGQQHTVDYIKNMEHPVTIAFNNSGDQFIKFYTNTTSI